MTDRAKPPGTVDVPPHVLAAVDSIEVNAREYAAVIGGNRSALTELVDAQEALEDYIENRQHIGPDEANLAALALQHVRRARVSLTHGALGK